MLDDNGIMHRAVLLVAALAFLIGVASLLTSHWLDAAIAICVALAITVPMAASALRRANAEIDRMIAEALDDEHTR